MNTIGNDEMEKNKKMLLAIQLKEKRSPKVNAEKMKGAEELCGRKIKKNEYIKIILNNVKTDIAAEEQYAATGSTPALLLTERKMRYLVINILH